MSYVSATICYITCTTTRPRGELWVVEGCLHVDPSSPLHQSQLTTWKSCGRHKLFNKLWHQHNSYKIGGETYTKKIIKTLIIPKRSIIYHSIKPKWANALFAQKFQVFAPFPKLIREMPLFCNSIFSKSSFNVKLDS